jgi:hypothetical protein
MAIRVIINCGIKRPLTGTDPQIKGMKIMVADQRVAYARIICSEIRSNSTMVPRQYAQDRLAVRLAGMQAGPGIEREG